MAENKEEADYILSENLKWALADAIMIREKYEQGWKYGGESAYLAGLKSNLEYLKKHDVLYVRS